MNDLKSRNLTRLLCYDSKDLGMQRNRMCTELTFGVSSLIRLFRNSENTMLVSFDHQVYHPFQSYPDDFRVIMTGYVQLNLINS